MEVIELGLIILYFLPTILAWKKSFALQVFLLNLFLGWTFIGWVIALVWAAKKENK
ncbi:MAG TPA: superinfection immunity protein [Bacteroidia bacterium]|nr:superinfection immunity protein [Bacteroidia bacterium]